MSISDVTDVEIDDGVFKYVQIRITDGKGQQKIIIRGNVRAEFHADISDEVTPGLKTLGFEAETIGGGRINREWLNQSIFIYGYSIGFGKADHKITVDLVKKCYPDYEVTMSDEGY